MPNMEDIRNFVVQGYRDILKREPGHRELGHYTNEISLGKMTKERFLEILKTSKKYISPIEEHGPEDIPKTSNVGSIKDPMEDIRNFVTQGYRDILKREPDPGGLEHYIGYISSEGITRDRFLEILRTSEEYMNRFG